MLAFLGAAILLAAADERTQKAGSDEPVLSWNMSGGIAAFCDELSVWPDGKIRRGTCKFGGRDNSGKLGREDAARLDGWMKKFGRITISSNDPAVNDGLSVTLKLRGSGSERPSEPEKQRILEWAQDLYNADRP
jgi:hypothetical protein